MATPEIQQLLALITEATTDACKVYADARIPIPSITTPTNIPPEQEAHTLALKKAIRLLEGACDQLCRTLAPPLHSLNYRTLSHVTEATVLGIVNDYRIADILLDHPEGLHASEIAKHPNVPIDEDRVARIMRLLASRHCFIEVSENVFANNRLSSSLLSSSNASSLVTFSSEEARLGFGALPTVWKDPEWANSNDAKKSPFSYAIKDTHPDMTLFEYVNTTPERRQTFGNAMLAYNEIAGSLATLDVFPWGDLPQDTTFCDVGGGLGAIAIPLSKNHPHLKITVQDQQGTIDQAKPLWEKHNPSFVNAGRLTLRSIDFFTESPVENQDIYYLRYILHDWSDEMCHKILGNVRKSMGPHSRLLIDDRLVQAACPKPTGTNGVEGLADRQAPPPLLSNFGAGNLSVYAQDIFMLMAFNGKERMLSNLKALGDQHGLEITKIYDMSEQAIVEFRIKQ